MIEKFFFAKDRKGSNIKYRAAIIKISNIHFSVTISDATTNTTEKHAYVNSLESADKVIENFIKLCNEHF